MGGNQFQALVLAVQLLQSRPAVAHADAFGFTRRTSNPVVRHGQHQFDSHLPGGDDYVAGRGAGSDAVQDRVLYKGLE